MAEPLPLNALKAFAAAARHMSFSKAAEELHFTPAAVSQQIKTLEELLGVQLFQRLNRSLALTQAAQAGLPKVEEGLKNLGEGVRKIRGQSSQRVLTVCMAPSFAAKWLIRRLHGFAVAHPDIELRISVSTDLIDSGQASSSLAAESFRKKDVDIAIRFGKGEYPLPGQTRIDAKCKENYPYLISPKTQTETFA